MSALHKDYLRWVDDFNKHFDFIGANIHIHSRSKESFNVIDCEKSHFLFMVKKKNPGDDPKASDVSGLKLWPASVGSFPLSNDRREEQSQCSPQILEGKKVSL